MYNHPVNTQYGEKLLLKYGYMYLFRLLKIEI